jgi:hypothetical protein
MIFIESPAFTEDVKRLLTDESYGLLQLHLTEYPFAGDLIKGTGGLRKVRWASGGKGKSGGVRVIYFHVVADGQIRMILIYKKGIKDDLTSKEKKVLRKLNEEWQR